ncbi:hypothetical protein B0O99DRAFT_317565 [Bisporella sp. PMI_857]|nr:hypothetical protein B0O99DRAFT_317565 [Bisporella sp. PMI_857]
MDKEFTQLLPRTPTRDLAYDSSKVSQPLGTPIKEGRKTSAKERPYDAMIRHLYVCERRPIDKVHDIVNGKFRLTKEKRYYKHCIKRLKIERNVNAKDKQKIVQGIKILQCTTENLESRLQVWVRGHNVDRPRWSRWLKDNRLIPQSIPLGPPSPLPSYIKISPHQSPEPASSVLSEGHICECESVTRAEEGRDVIQRLNKYAEYENPKLDLQQSKAVLEDLQIILSRNDAPAVGESRSYKWDTIMDEYTIKAKEIIAGNIINEKLSAAIVDQHPLKTKDQLQIGRRVSAAQNTRYGLVEFTYWIGPKGSHFDFANQCTDTSRLDLARLSIVPRETAPFRIVIDVTPWLNLPAKIAYQPMISNNSEVFNIAKSGQVEALQRAIGKGTASLLDRDEQGRPLLYYAAGNLHVELSQYLIKHGADVNELVEVERFIR